MRARALVVFASSVVILSSVARLSMAEERTCVAVSNEGDVVKGDVVEKVDGDHVTLSTASGAERRLAWSEMASLTCFGKHVELRDTQEGAPGRASTTTHTETTTTTTTTTHTVIDTSRTAPSTPLPELAPLVPDAPPAPAETNDDLLLRIQLAKLTAPPRTQATEYVEPRKVFYPNPAKTILGWTFTPLGAVLLGSGIAAFSGAFDGPDPEDHINRYTMGLPFLITGTVFTVLGVVNFATNHPSKGQATAKRGIQLGAGKILF